MPGKALTSSVIRKDSSSSLTPLFSHTAEPTQGRQSCQLYPQITSQIWLVLPLLLLLPWPETASLTWIISISELVLLYMLTSSIIQVRLDYTQATNTSRSLICLSIYTYVCAYMGFPGGASGEESACQPWTHKRCGFDPWVRKTPWRRAWKPTPVFLPGESPWTEAHGGLQSIESHWVRYDWSKFVCVYIHMRVITHNLWEMQETQVWSLGWENPLEEGMAKHSSTLAWKIPWTEEAGRLQSMVWQTVRDDWVTSTFTAYIHLRMRR